jgi:hypothetical protein
MKMRSSSWPGLLLHGGSTGEEAAAPAVTTGVTGGLAHGDGETLSTVGAMAAAGDRGRRRVDRLSASTSPSSGDGGAWIRPPTAVARGAILRRRWRVERQHRRAGVAVAARHSRPRGKTSAAARSERARRRRWRTGRRSRPHHRRAAGGGRGGDPRTRTPLSLSSSLPRSLTSVISRLKNQKLRFLTYICHIAT